MTSSVSSIVTPTTLIRSFTALTTINSFEARQIDVYDSSLTNRDVVRMLNRGEYDRFSIQGDDAGTMYVGDEPVAKIVGYDAPMKDFAVVEGLSPEEVNHLILEDEEYQEPDYYAVYDLDDENFDPTQW